MQFCSAARLCPSCPDTTLDGVWAWQPGHGDVAKPCGWQVAQVDDCWSLPWLTGKIAWLKLAVSEPPCSGWQNRHVEVERPPSMVPWMPLCPWICEVTPG